MLHRAPRGAASNTNKTSGNVVFPCNTQRATRSLPARSLSGQSGDMRHVPSTAPQRCLPANLLIGQWGHKRLVTSTALQRCRAGQPALEERSVTDKAEHRRNVGVCVMNNKGLVFAARRVDDKYRTWQMPQGGIDPLENPMEAALRELHEETGMRSVRLVSSLDHWLHYDFPTEVRHHMTGDWLRYKGQTQKWFLLHFYGDDSEIDLSHAGHPEFSEYTWMALEELPLSVVEFKRAVYAEVAHEFIPRISDFLAERR